MPDAQRAEIAKLEALHAEHPQGRIFTHLAEAYRKAGELDRAREVLAEGIDRHPDYSSAHVVLGRVLMDMGEDAEAKSEFHRVLELDSQNLVALRCLGDLARDGGRRDEAAEYYGRLLDVEPSDDDVRRLLDQLETLPAGEDVVPGPEEGAPAGIDAPADATRDEAPYETAEAPFEAEEAGYDAEEPSHYHGAARDDEGSPVAGPDVEEGLPGEPGLSGDGLGLDDDLSTPQEPWTTESSRGEAPAYDPLDEPWIAGAEAEEEGAFPEAGSEGPWESTEDVDEAVTPGGGEEPGVMTETIAQIYARQGLYDRAAEVYRELARVRPGDTTLRTRLEEMEALAAAPSPGTGDPEAADPALDEGLGVAEEEPTSFDSGPIEGFETTDLDTGIDVPPLAGLESDELDPETHLRPVEGAPEIEGLPEDAVRDVPAPPEEEEEAQVGAWSVPDDAAADEVADIPDDEAWGPAEPLEEDEPWSVTAPGEEDAGWSTARPAPEEALAEPTDEAEPWASAPSSDAEAAGEEPGEWAGEPAGAEVVEEEQVEAMWTGAAGVSGAEESPYAWSETEEEAEGDASEPIGSYFRSLLGWGGRAGAEAASTAESTAPDAPEPGPLEPETAPAAESSEAPEPEPGGQADASSDDDDLDTFRSWLESLKQ